MNEIKTRRQAAEAGESKYFTGKPCKHGHNAARYTCSGICSACNTAHARAYNGRLSKLANNRAAGNFAYPCHPDDAAALLAYAQGLDLARGRVPFVPGAATPAGEPQTPEQIHRFRELALGRALDAVKPDRPSVDMAEAWLRDVPGMRS